MFEILCLMLNVRKKYFPILSICLKKLKLVLRMFIIHFAYNEHTEHVKIVSRDRSCCLSNA
jgi:hypothetical protein